MTEWSDELLLNAKGNLRSCVANVVSILGHDTRWAGVFGYDETRESAVKLKPAPWHEHDAPATPEVGDFTEADAVRLSAWLAREHDMNVNTTAAVEAVDLVARRNRFNPVRSYFEGLRWDGEVRLPHLFPRYFGADDNDYTRNVGTKFMIAAVARGFEAGCKVDNVPVIEGAQGTRKSTGIRALCPDPAWFFDSDLEIGSKDAPQVLRGKFLIELGEMSAMSKSDRNALKAFVTRQVDTYRPSYGRRAQDFPRRWVAIGTTNEATYLRDPTGSRRWWPVRTGRINVDAIERDRDMLWAEAVVRYEQHEPWHVDSVAFARQCEQEQAERFQADPWEQPIAEWLRGQTRFVTTTRVLTEALYVERARLTRAEEMRVSEILVRLGWRKGNRRSEGGVRVYPYDPPASPVSLVGQEVGHDSTGESEVNPILPNLPDENDESGQGDAHRGQEPLSTSKPSGWAGRAVGQD